MFVENNQKSYFSSNNAPQFGWPIGSTRTPAVGEQQLGVVWVVANPPAPGNNITDQEAFNRDSAQTGYYDPSIPRYARPASSHSGGANVTFCDGHSAFQREDIDYVVYVQLMTPNGKKVVDPSNHSNSGVPISTFRIAPPLSEKDYQ
jgi:prepilin-type processing-associated H-X9-DG protein